MVCGRNKSWNSNYKELLVMNNGKNIIVLGSYPNHLNVH